MTENKITYVVKDEHTLGYVYDGTDISGFGSMSVLQGSVRRGGHNWLNGSVAFVPGDLRLATLEDFSEYGVMLPPNFSQ